MIDPLMISDFVHTNRVLETLRESVQQAFPTRLLILWREQNPGKPDPDPEAPFAITFTAEVVASVVDELARNASQQVIFVETTKLPKELQR